MIVIDLEAKETDLVRHAALLLMEGFKEDWPGAWTTMDSAQKEVEKALHKNKICRVALNSQGQLLGWIGALPQYDGHVWELHPLVVAKAHRKKGVGRALVRDLEHQVKLRGGLTIWLGSDDENNMTSLSNVDLFQDTWEKIRSIRNLRNHPYEFYQKLGFNIVGVMPDANGPGKPDIFMAKKVE